MSKIIPFKVLFLCIALSSCIFIIDEKEELRSEDSSAAFAYADSILMLDSLRRMDSIRIADSLKSDAAIQIFFSGKDIDTKNVQPHQLVDYAKTLIGVPYKYASTDPAKGFDCSGFITYVFNHFNIIVPRSSIDFTEVGQEIPVASAKPGDLILFTGTDSTEKFVGHMGIIVNNNRGITEFIHATSGKAYGVTITPFNDYYKSRYVKTVRVF